MKIQRWVKVYRWGSNGKPEMVGRGVFMQYGCDYSEYETGPGNYSTAIVEMDDGTVRNVPIEGLVFDAPPG